MAFVLSVASKLYMLSVVMLNVVMPSVVMLSVVMLSVIMLNVVMLSVVMLTVVAPIYTIHLLLVTEMVTLLSLSPWAS